jgi:hypothetical protein
MQDENNSPLQSNQQSNPAVASEEMVVQIGDLPIALAPVGNPRYDKTLIISCLIALVVLLCIVISVLSTALFLSYKTYQDSLIYNTTYTPTITSISASPVITPTPSPLPTEIPVFDTPRIVLYSPKINATFNGASVTFKGKMKGFFEGVMGVRLIGGNGGTLYDGSIYATSDNYTDFSSFENIISGITIPSTSGSDAHWELYETSMKDGSKTVLITIPVTLK